MRELKSELNSLIAGRTNSEYRDDNKDKIREHKKHIYTQNKDKISEQHKQYYEANKDEIHKKSKQYRHENIDIIKKHKKDFYELNKDEINKKQRTYWHANKDMLKINATQPIECEFGSTIQKHEKQRHSSSKKHQNFINN